MIEYDAEKVLLETDGVLDEVVNGLFGAESFSEARARPVRVAIKDGKPVETTFGRFAVAVQAAYPLGELYGSGELPEIRGEWFDPPGGADSGALHAWMNGILDDLSRARPDPAWLGKSMENLVNSVAWIGVMANKSAGVTVNLWSLCDLADRDSRLRELLDCEFPTGLSYSEIERFAAARLEELGELLGAADTPYRPLLNSGAAINRKQMGQLFLLVGLKPDIHGDIIDKPVNTSFLRGLKSEEDMMTNAIGARKALVENYTQVRNSGYFARKLTLLLTNHSLSRLHDETGEPAVCGSPRGLEVAIGSAERLRRLDGRETLDGEVLRASEPERWVGRRVEIRSPVTCSMEYLDDAAYRRGSAFVMHGVSDAAFATLEQSVFTERSLVATFPLDAAALYRGEECPGAPEVPGDEFGDDRPERAFPDFDWTCHADFDRNGERLTVFFGTEPYPRELPGVVRGDADGRWREFLAPGPGDVGVTTRHASVRHARGVCPACYGRDLRRLNEGLHAGIVAVLFLTNRLTQMLLSSKHLLQTRAEDVEWPEEFSKWFHVDRTRVVATRNAPRVSFAKADVEENDDGEAFLTAFSVDGTAIASPKELHLSGLTKDRLGRSDADVVRFNAPEGSELFRMHVDNAEMSASLKAIQALLDGADHAGADPLDPSAVLERFLELLEDSGIELASVHAEMIVRALTRRADDRSSFPDWTGEEPPEVEVLTVKQALSASPWLADGLAFEKIKQQLSNPDTYAKDGVSLLDELFL